MDAIVTGGLDGRLEYQTRVTTQRATPVCMTSVCGDWAVPVDNVVAGSLYL